MNRLAVACRERLLLSQRYEGAFVRQSPDLMLEAIREILARVSGEPTRADFAQDLNQFTEKAALAAGYAFAEYSTEVCDWLRHTNLLLDLNRTQFRNLSTEQRDLLQQHNDHLTTHMVLRNLSKTTNEDRRVWAATLNRPEDDLSYFGRAP